MSLRVVNVRFLHVSEVWTDSNCKATIVMESFVAASSVARCFPCVELLVTFGCMLSSVCSLFSKQPIALRCDSLVSMF